MKIQTLEPVKRSSNASLPSEEEFGNSRTYAHGMGKRISLRPVRSLTKRQSIRPLPLFNKKEKENSAE